MAVYKSIIITPNNYAAAAAVALWLATVYTIYLSA